MEEERAKEREMFKKRMAAEEAKKAQRESERQEVKKIKERSEKTNENVEQSSENLGVTDKVNENITNPRHDADSHSSPDDLSEQTPQAVQDNKSSYYQHKSSIDINNEETASQGGSDIKKLALELDVDNVVAPQDDKDPTNLSNEPSFDSNSASGEQVFEIG